MKTVLVIFVAVLFLLTSGNAMAQQGKGRGAEPSDKAYEQANEKAKFLRDESTEKGKALGTEKEKGQGAVQGAKDASAVGKGKKDEVKKGKALKSDKTKGKEGKNQSKKGGKGKKDTAE
ncbi:MAG: hypothetical protein C4576_21270 [Desulfobacteraceae bacterium]|nr:MAG: hypothetical protein C4576_21270 [Desulfobacteraceae bacterium]